jgi:hypothetical protein
MADQAAAVEALGTAIAARVPVLLWGAPGTGKTSVIRAMDAAAGWPCETVIASIREPSDFAGLPIVSDGGTDGVRPSLHPPGPSPSRTPARAWCSLTRCRPLRRPCKRRCYRRPSRRAHLNRQIVLPTLHRPIPEVAIVCDTSGSMHERLLARALAEIEAVLTRAGLRQAQVRVLAVDTAVHAVRRVSRATQVQLAGGGGTDMGRGIYDAAELKPRPSVVIVLTDGFTPWPE